MGKEWLRGTEEDTRPDPAHRRGGWCGVEAGRRELASAAMAEKKTTSVRGLNECKTKQRGGGPSWAMPHGGRGSTGPGIRPAGGVPIVARPRRTRAVFRKWRANVVDMWAPAVGGRGSEKRERRGRTWAGPGRKRVGRA
jgi:hypothetical protein